jgi:cytochrome P450
VPAVADLDLPEFGYTTDPSIRGPRFHAVMRDLRARHWLARDQMAVFVLDREAVSFFLRSKATTFPGMLVAEVFGVTEGPLYEEIRHNILHVNGDDHRRLRNLVNPAFTPRAADRWRPAMRGFLEQLWAQVGEAGRCEFVDAVAKPYPSLTIATVMGAPLAAAPRLHEWSTWIQRQFSADLVTERERIERACEEFYAFAGELLEARRADRGEDLVSQLVEARDGQDRLSDVELVNLVLNVLVGGVDTTQSQLSHGIRLFAEHPDQWALLLEDPSLAPAAVEEILRFEPITPFTARVTLEDVTYRDVLFPEGTIVMVSAFDANRDEATYDDPERFDITAPRQGHPYTFGAGIHYCLGSNLAKAELQEALVFLSRRMPELALDGEPAFDSINGIYGLLELPIRW